MGWIGSLLVALLVSGGGSEGVALVGVGVVDVESGEVLPSRTVLIVGRAIRAGDLDQPALDLLLAEARSVHQR